MLSFPDDVLRVRLYRHEAQAFDGVMQLDSAYAPGIGMLVASVGMDGRASLLHADETDLMPCRRRDQASRLYTLLTLRPACRTSASGAGAAGKDSGGRLACDLGWSSTCITTELTDASPKGDIGVPLRASLTAVRFATLPRAGQGQGRADVQPVAVVGSFSGLCRLIDVVGMH